MNNQSFRVLIKGSFVGTAASLQEANVLARQMANRMKLIGSIPYEIFDEKNNRCGGGRLYST